MIISTAVLSLSSTRHASNLVVDVDTAIIKCIFISFMRINFLGFIEGVLNDSLKYFEDAAQKVSCNVKVYTVSISFYHEFKSIVNCLVRTGYRFILRSLVRTGIA